MTNGERKLELGKSLKRKDKHVSLFYGFYSQFGFYHRTRNCSTCTRAWINYMENISAVSTVMGHYDKHK